MINNGIVGTGKPTSFVSELAQVRPITQQLIVVLFIDACAGTGTTIFGSPGLGGHALGRELRRDLRGRANGAVKNSSKQRDLVLEPLVGPARP